MTFDEILTQVLALLRREGRVSYRALKRRFDLDEDYLEDLKAEIIQAKKLAVDEESAVLVWAGEAATVSALVSDQARAPLAYTPAYLAEKILTSRAALEGERKQVTVLFADLKGSTELIEGLDPEEARQLLDPALHLMMEAVHRYEGTVNQVLGDGIMALFGAPVAHEDHAVRACYASLAIQAAMHRYAEEVRRSHGLEMQIRVGLNSGEVVVRAIGNDLHMDYSAVGQTTHLAARGLTRFVGRQQELTALQQALERAGAAYGQVVAVVAEAGVGKSRLVYEFVHWRDCVGAGRSPSHHTPGWLVLESASVSYGKATPYFPIIDLLKRYSHVEERDDTRTIRAKVTGQVLTLDAALQDTVPALLSLLDALPEDSPFLQLDPPQRRQRTLDALKRILLRESQEQPLLLVFEDLHWIDAATQALLDSLVESLPTARLLLLVNYRPEYQHGWGSKTYYTQLRLDPLPPVRADEFLHALLGNDPSLEPLKQLLIARTEGNPFFLEESVRTLVETEGLVGERGAYRLGQALPTIQVPATVQAVLAARIDRLPLEEKRLLQTAAVIGTEVPRPLLQAIADIPEAAFHRGLAHLQAAEFLYETRLFPDQAYTFKHALTHEVAYGGVLQERRRVLHAYIVAALEALAGDQVAEQVNRLAHHALRGEVWDKALAYGRQAGEKALALAGASGDVVLQALANQYLGEAHQAQGDYRRAIDRYTRTVASLDGARRHERFGQVIVPAVSTLAWLAWCHAELGTFTEGRALGDEGLRIAEAVAHPASLMYASWGIGLLALRQGDLTKALLLLERAVGLCQDVDFPVYFPRIAAPLGAAYTLGGRIADAVPLLTQALAQTRATGTVAYQPFCQLALGEAQRVAGSLEEAYTLAEGALALACAHQERGHQAYALRLLGEIAAQREPPESVQAEGHYQQALTLADELGMRPLVAHCHLGLGTLYAKINRREQSCAELSAAIALYRAMDMTFWLPQAEAALAQVKILTGRLGSGEALL